MKRLLYASAVLVLIASPALLQTRAVGQTAGKAPAAAEPNQHQAMLNTYCTSCHNNRAKIGGLALDVLDLQAAADNAEIWEKVLRKLRGHLMPPPGSPQPSQKDLDSFAGWMENTLDTRAKGPKAGYVQMQRLNRTEYTASVKALVGVELKATDVLPQDGQLDGFDNIATALTVSPAFLSQYITAARQVAKAAIGSPNPRVGNTKYTIAANQNPDVPLPLGTRGGIGFKHNFPTDGEYRITINDLGVGIYASTLENQSTLVIMVDGKVVFRQTIGGPEDWQLHAKGPKGRAQIMERFSKIPVQAEAGVHDVVVAFIDRSHVESPHNIADPFFDALTLSCSCAPPGRRNRLVDGVVISGPFNPKGVSRTLSRDLVFVCDAAQRKPDRAQPQVDADEESSCARRITENLAHRAYRRPVTADEVTRLMRFYEAARKSGTFDQGIEQVVAAVLASPNFLYRGIWGAPVTARGAQARAERERDSAKPQKQGAARNKGSGANTEFALTDLELASRLSFFLWNTGPDQELLTLAESRGLTKPGAPSVLEKQVRRMLADPKASSLVTNFAMKWLNLDSLDSVKPDPILFPGFTDQLRRDFSTEAEAFLSSILLEDRNIIGLLTADHTFLNERLARHYGVSGVSGPQFRRVTLTENERFGLLGKAAVLMRTSYADRTSPVLRGAWVLDKLLGTPPTPPPPDTATDLSQKAGDQPKTVRARLELHRDKASCKMCHGVIDPTGLALENFDAIGAWRTVDGQAKAPIDASTVLPNGVKINGVVELRAQLVDRPATFVNAMTERLMMYAINRKLEYFDMPQVRSIVRGSAKDNYKLSSIVVGIVNSDSFRKQERSYE
jgi:mono/diheme cytochrome c family protein